MHETRELALEHSYLSSIRRPNHSCSKKSRAQHSMQLSGGRRLLYFLQQSIVRVCVCVVHVYTDQLQGIKYFALHMHAEHVLNTEQMASKRTSRKRVSDSRIRMWTEPALI